MQPIHNRVCLYGRAGAKGMQGGGVPSLRGKARLGEKGKRRGRGVRRDKSKETGASIDQQTGLEGHGPACRHLAKPKLRKAQTWSGHDPCAQS